MESIFTHDLFRAIALAALFWIGVFTFTTAMGVRATNVYLSTGILVIAVLLLVGLISPFASLILSIGFHSVVLLLLVYSVSMAFIVNRKK